MQNLIITQVFADIVSKSKSYSIITIKHLATNFYIGHNKTQQNK